MNDQPTFGGGANIALKIPKAFFLDTIAFYKDVLGLDVQEHTPWSDSKQASYFCQFGPITIWFDQVDAFSKCDTWLEISADNMDSALKHFSENNVPVRNELEVLPKDMKGCWISDPAGNILLVHQPEKK